MTGRDIVDRLVDRLIERHDPCFDHNIVYLLKSLTAEEVLQLWSLGDIVQWHNERTGGLASDGPGN